MRAADADIDRPMTRDYCSASLRSLHWPRFYNAREGKMKNPLDSLWGTVITGFVLTVILYYVVKSLIGG